MVVKFWTLLELSLVGASSSQIWNIETTFYNFFYSLIFSFWKFEMALYDYVQQMVILSVWMCKMFTFIHIGTNTVIYTKHYYKLLDAST